MITMMQVSVGSLGPENYFFSEWEEYIISLLQVSIVYVPVVRSASCSQFGVSTLSSPRIITAEAAQGGMMPNGCILIHVRGIKW